MQSKMKKYVMLAVILGILIPINYFVFKGKPDTAIEQAEEEIIKETTGISIDLTPNN